MSLHAVCHTCEHQHLIMNGSLKDSWLAWQAKHLGHDTDLIMSEQRWQGYRHNADFYPSYLASSNLTVTNLNSLAASPTHVAGWESPLIDNTGAAPRALDFSVDAKITVAASGVEPGEIKLWLVKMLDDATWPDVFDGVESAETLTDTEIRDAICRLGAVSLNDVTLSRVYYMSVPSTSAVFGGNQPHKFVVFITQNTVAALAATGNQVTVKGSYITGV